MAAKFETKKTPAGFHFNLKAPNGKYILTSETYKDESGMKKGIESVRKNAPIEKQYEFRESKKGDGYFVLLAKNKEIIGKSQIYKTTKGLKNGVASCIKFAAGANVVAVAAPAAAKKAAKASKAAKTTSAAL